MHHQGSGWHTLSVAALLFGLLQPQAAMAGLDILNCQLTPPNGMIFVTTLVDEGLKSTTSFNVSCTTIITHGNGKGNGGVNGNGGGNGNAGGNGNGNGNGNSGSARFSIGLSAGSSGDPTMRKLANGSSQLSYNFYQDSAFQLPWDNAMNLKTLTITGDVSIPVTIYGKINNNAANLKTQAGRYSDAITVTIIW